MRHRLRQDLREDASDLVSAAPVPGSKTAVPTPASLAAGDGLAEARTHESEEGPAGPKGPAATPKEELSGSDKPGPFGIPVAALAAMDSAYRNSILKGVRRSY